MNQVTRGVSPHPHVVVVVGWPTQSFDQMIHEISRGRCRRQRAVFVFCRRQELPVQTLAVEQRYRRGAPGPVRPDSASTVGWPMVTVARHCPRSLRRHRDLPDRRGRSKSHFLAPDPDYPTRHTRDEVRNA